MGIEHREKVLSNSAQGRTIFLIHLRLFPRSLAFLHLTASNFYFFCISPFCVCLLFVPLRKFRSQISDSMDTWKSRGGKSQRTESEKEEDAGAPKGRKVTEHCVFPMYWGSRGSPSRLTKAARAEPFGRCRSQDIQNTSCPDFFGSRDVQKVQGGVAGSAFGSQKCKELRISDHTWMLVKKSTPLWREGHARNMFGS